MELKNFLFLILVLLILLVNAGKCEHSYYLMGAKTIKPSGWRPGRDVICEHSKEELMEMCRGALNERFLKDFNYRFTPGSSMGPILAYDVVYSETSREIVSACKCPIEPEIYLCEVDAPGKVGVIFVRPRI